MRWFVTLVLGAAGGFLAARATMRSELDQLRRELAGGNGRPSVAPPPAEPAPEPPVQETLGEAAHEAVAEAGAPEHPGLDPTTVMLIAASVAAYLGKRAVVRRIKVAGHRAGDPWALSGRTTLQASHNIVQVHPHGR